LVIVVKLSVELVSPGKTTTLYGEPIMSVP